MSLIEALLSLYAKLQTWGSIAKCTFTENTYNGEEYPDHDLQVDQTNVADAHNNEE
jgi:hypothetical protein